MSSSPTLVNSLGFTTDAVSFATSGWSYAPSASLLDFVVGLAVDDGGGSPNPTLSGSGVTWGALSDGTTTCNVLDSGSRIRLRAFRSVSGTPSAGDLTLSTGALTCERAALAAVQVSESSLGNVRQVVTGSGTGLTASISLAAVGSAANLIVGVFAARNPFTTLTVGGSFSSLLNVGIESDTRLLIQTAVNQTTVNCSLGSSANWCGFAFEVVNVTGGAGAARRAMHHRAQQRGGV